MSRIKILDGTLDGGLDVVKCSLKVYQTERAPALQARGVDLKGLYCKGGGGRKEAKKLGMEEGRKSSHIKFSVTIFSPLPFINRHISALGGRIWKFSSCGESHLNLRGFPHL